MYNKSLDLSTIIGIVSTLLLISVAISISGNIKAFFNIPSLLIVLLGTFCVTSASFNIFEVINSHIQIANNILYRGEDPKNAATKALEIASFARNSGLAALEEKSLKSKFNKNLHKGIMLAVDKVSEEKIHALLTQEINTSAEEYIKVISILRKSAEIAPAMGLIGTLVGLVQMLGDLNDITKIGPSMALALLTTFYGAILAYVIFFPYLLK